MEVSRISILLKYFLHGISFSGLFLVLGIVWVFIFAVLVIIGFIIGFIIGLLLLFFIMGGLNTVLTDFIWGIIIKSDWKSLLAHGFVLFIALLIVSIPSLIINSSVLNLATLILVFIIYCFIDGFMAKSIAGYWQEEYEEATVSNISDAEAAIDANVKKLYKKMLLDYATRYGSLMGESILKSNLKDYLKKGLSEEEAIKKLAEAKGYTD